VAAFRNATGDLDAAESDALRVLVERARFELIPLRDAIDRVGALSAGAPTTVTASPSHRIEATLDLAEALRARGHPVTPHLSAHMIRDRGHLAELVERCRAAGIRDAFVIGGDARDRGAFHDAPALLRALAEVAHPFERIGVAAYPEGHPHIPSDRLLAALRVKQSSASYMTTQMCFDAVAIAAWVARTRAAGITLPIHLGVPGPVAVRKLLRIAARIGVGGSARYVRKNRHLLGFVFRRSHTPDRLLRSLAATIADDDADIRGLHLFTFNQVEAAEEWRRRTLDQLSEPRRS
jgi:methylenetetrahydrofolate reductase (NADPH)